MILADQPPQPSVRKAEIAQRSPFAEPVADLPADAALGNVALLAGPRH
jgi:hypothetical protein